MVYTEKRIRNNNSYYYRVMSVREGSSVKKKRLYLGRDLGAKELSEKEILADRELMFLNNLLTLDEEKDLNKILKKFRSHSKKTEENRYESFVSFFTYDSNAIEGNSMTLEETSYLLFEKNVPSQKSLREINETLNHKEAFDVMLKNEDKMTKKFILEMHRLVVKNTLRDDLENEVGKYRSLQVYIRGKEWMPSKPKDVPKEMKELLTWYSKNESKLNPLVLAAYFHIGFETIHPLVDGNGRVGRILMNYILRKFNFPMANIPNKRKFEYYSTLHKAQVGGDIRPFVLFLLDVLGKSQLLF